MPGPMVVVDTLMAQVGLDVSRSLYMGADVTLRFIKPDDTGLVSDGIVIVREYTNSFDRIPEAEREIGDGQTIVVDFADYGFPEGQVRADIGGSKFIQFVISGVEGPLLEMNKVPLPAFNEAQVYRITCGSRTLKQTYNRVGKT